ncbi:hypothetical protein [Peribacillus sp. R9-11]|uniref:hypothetical protein n=1 Tax=Peribacillus sp. R9-11 TaxID=3073271 RepID=UPI002868E55C|nr:hypothetical protein [Peribacillus sp. R9-11]WMX58512.1 hypothetical protein RE409_28780 [Peribacillus sp. R9-11]
MFIKAKKKREELLLPILHYVVADDWIDKLGPKAFTSWLKFHTWVNRADEKINDISQAKIPMSIEKVAEKLEMNKSTLYRTIIPVLWEYGLIDLVEYEDSKRKTQKPINIIPYDYPQNNKELETSPLEKCRDWKMNYNTTASFFARQGGRKLEKSIKIDGCKNTTVDGCENATVDGCENATVTVAKMQPINVLNNFNNVSNNYINHESNTLLMDEEEGLDYTDRILYKSLIYKDIDAFIAKTIVILSEENELFLYEYEVVEQYKQMYLEMQLEGKEIIDYPKYFLNGIIMQRQQRKTKKHQRDLKRILEEKNKRQNKKTEPSKPVPFYNWLEDN